MGQSLCVLDFPEMQRKVVGRLDASLESKWGNQVFKAYENNSKVPFKDFSAWVMKLAERHSRPNLKFEGGPSVPPPKPGGHYHENSPSRTPQPPASKFNPLASSTRVSTQEKGGSTQKCGSAGRGFLTSDRQDDAAKEPCPVHKHLEKNHLFWVVTGSVGRHTLSR